jgi:uncharacterized membrane protein
MSLWFIAGIIPPLLWAVVNHIDKYLLSRTSHPSSVNVLMVYSTGFSAVVIPLMLLFGYEKLFVDWKQVIIQIIGGVLMSVSIYCYLLALDREEASKVIPLVLLVPIFGYIFSYFILGETLTVIEIIGCLLILLGALVITLEFREETRRIHIKHEVLLIMIVGAIFQAAPETLFKYVTLENSFVVSIFWQHVGILLYGVILLTFRKGLWGDFTMSVKSDGIGMVSFNFLSEALNAGAHMVRDYAFLLAPVAVIMTLNGYQPLFVFIIGIALTLLIPKIIKENIHTSHLIHKGSAIAIMIIGTILIAQNL